MVNCVGDLDEAELGGDVEDPLLGPAGEVHGDHGQIEGQLAEEVAVGDRVERVVRDFGHGEEVGGFVAVDGEGGAGDGAGAEGGDVDAFEAVVEAVFVALEHFAIGEDFVAGDDGLGALQVGEGGHGVVALLGGHVDEGALGVGDFFEKDADGFAAPEADVEGDLVVAGAGGVEAAAGLADAVDEFGLDGHVDVFLGDVGVEFAGFDILEDGQEAGFDGGEVFSGEQADGVEHGGVGDGAEDIVLGEAEIEGEGFDELDGEGILGSADAGLPGFLGCGRRGLGRGFGHGFPAG